MLERNRFFKEEVVANIFICLEGCLHLLQKKWGDSKPTLNLKLLEINFKSVLNEESLFEFIKEAYSKRIALLHPQSKWGSQWMPYVDFHDFFDYYKICKHLLRYYLTDDIIDTTKTAHNISIANSGAGIGAISSGNSVVLWFGA